MSMFGYDPGYQVDPFIRMVWGELGSDSLEPEQEKKLLAAETIRIENMIRRKTPSRAELCRAYEYLMKGETHRQHIKKNGKL